MGSSETLLDTPFPLRGVREVPTAPKWGPTAPRVRLRRKSAIGNHRCPNFARARGVGRVRTAAAAAESEAGRGWLGWVGKEGRGEPVFTRVLQDIEGHCLGCVRRVLQSEGWPVRSWQQKGLLEEDANEWKAAAGRGSGGGEPTM